VTADDELKSARWAADRATDDFLRAEAQLAAAHATRQRALERLAAARTQARA
jgi:hypothetical protein